MQGFENFITFVKDECKKNKVNFRGYKRNYVKLSNNVKCGGYFEAPDGVNVKKGNLAFANGSKEAMPILVHEYCHMTQWLDKLPLWGLAEVSNSKLDRWLNGENIRGIKKHIDISKELELENEKRSVEMIKKWNLPIDVDLYTKKANAYVLFYLHLKDTRKWSKPGNSPYSNQEIIDAMSNKFDMNYNTLDPGIKKLFKKHNI